MKESLKGLDELAGVSSLSLGWHGIIPSGADAFSCAVTTVQSPAASGFRRPHSRSLVIARYAALGLKDELRAPSRGGDSIARARPLDGDPGASIKTTEVVDSTPTPTERLRDRAD